jgi:DnaK suppressor protein
MIPMTRKEAILRARAKLVKRRDVLRRMLMGEFESLVEQRPRGEQDGHAGKSLGSGDDEIAWQLLEVGSDELARVELAIELIDNEEYGVCEGCRTNIPMARLEALPYATLCVCCQSEVERVGSTKYVLTNHIPVTVGAI